MSTTGTFLTFPLWSLALPDPPKDRLQLIVSHAIERAGTSNTSVELERVQEKGKDCPGFDRNNEKHIAFVRGAVLLNVTPGHVQGGLKRSETLRAFTDQLDALYGTGPLVFVSSELFWGCHNDDDPPYREFSTLCALNSVVGYKPIPVLIRRRMIIARQLGYKTPAAMAAELAKRTDQIPLTINQLRTTLDRLEGKGLMVRCQRSPRCVYFSTTLDREALREKVAAIHKRKLLAQSEREQDRHRMATISPPQNHHLKREQGKSTETPPLKKEAPDHHHNGTTPTTTTPPLKEMPLSKCPIKEVPLKSEEKKPAR